MAGLITRLTRRRAPRPPAGPSLADAPRVLVCGASGRIGAAVAEAFANNGARLHLHYHSNRSAAERLARRLATGAGAEHMPQPDAADLRDATAARELLERAAARLGGVDVLITCIGQARDNPLPMVAAADLAQCLEDNLRPVVNACEAFRAQRAGRPGGRIVNVSSITGLVGQPMRVAYGAAKGAVISYTKSLAREVAPEGMTANCVAPQVIDGGLADLMKLRVREILLDNTPVGRACTPADVAHAVTYLAAPGAGFVTGTALPVTGGLVTW